IKKSVAMPRIQALVTGKALDCYVVTYLGCDEGTWIGSSGALGMNVKEKPYTLSKVTIVDQTAERVVADVDEHTWELVDKGVLHEQDTWRRMTKADIKWRSDRSRYTISRGEDGVWRISDRKPQFRWLCASSPDELPVQ